MTPAEMLLTFVSPTPVPAKLIMKDTGWKRATLRKAIFELRKLGHNVCGRRNYVFVVGGYEQLAKDAERAYAQLPAK